VCAKQWWRPLVEWYSLGPLQPSLPGFAKISVEMFGWLCRLCLAGGRRWRGALAAAGVIVMFGCGDDGVKSDNVLFPECGETDVVPRPGASVRVMVPMRDCTRLATNVILPDGPGPYPVIVVRTPYGRANSEFLPLPGIGEAMFAPHGYAVVEQDTRGRFNSEGRFVPYLVERDDTVDTLDWIARQPWFNGKLGVWGLSYLGLTAELAMVARPELVDAAVVGEIRSDFYGAAFERGNIRADTVGLWLLGLLDKHNLNFSTPQEQARAMLQFPLIDGDVRVVGENIDFIDVFAEHTFEDAFWTEDLSRAQLVATDIPVMMLDGWFDLFAEGMLDDWTALRVARGGRDQYIVVGPWTHLLGFVDQDFSFPNGGSIANFLDDMVAFFDRYLKGEKLAMPTARYYDGGLSRWRSGNALWPAAMELVRQPRGNAAHLRRARRDAVGEDAGNRGGTRLRLRSEGSGDLAGREYFGSERTRRHADRQRLVCTRRRRCL